MAGSPRRTMCHDRRRAFRLTKIELAGMARVRSKKPQVPLVGQEGIPPRDMLELEKELR